MFYDRIRLSGNTISEEQEVRENRLHYAKSFLQRSLLDHGDPAYVRLKRDVEKARQEVTEVVQDGESIIW